MDKHHEVFITVMYKIPKVTRLSRKLIELILLKLRINVHARMYQNQKFDRDCKYAE